MATIRFLEGADLVFELRSDETPTVPDRGDVVRIGGSRTYFTVLSREFNLGFVTDDITVYLERI